MRRSQERLGEQWVVAAVHVASMFMSIMDSTIVNVALPTMGREFHATTASLQWVVVGYLLSLAVFVPASGYIGDRFGTKRIMLGSIALFVVASSLCAVAPNLDELVAARIVQGVGGGVMIPVGMSMLLRAFPPAERVRATRILMVPTVLAPASGPVIGGLLVTSASWRWIFLVNVPIGLVALAFGAWRLIEHVEHDKKPFDVAGFVLSGCGLALFLYALSEGPLVGWAETRVLVSGVLGFVGLAVFVRLELRRPHPLLQLDLLSDRLFRRSNAVNAFGSSAFTGALFVVPLYIQEARGLSALTSGLTTFPEAIGVITSTQLVGRLYSRVGPRRLMSAGLALVALFLVVMSLAGSDTNLWLVRIDMFGTGVGMAFMFLPLGAATYATISSSKTGHAAAIFNAQNRAGAAVFVAVLGTLLSAVGGHRLTPNIEAFHLAFLVCGAGALAAALCALRIDDRDARATMKPSPSESLEASAGF